MRKISLKRLLSQKEISALVESLTDSLGRGFSIEDEDGVSLLGTPGPDRARYPVTMNKTVMGYVAGEPKHSALADLLSHLAGQESILKAVAKETLDKYKEITLLYNLAERVAATVDVNEVGRVIVDEVKRLVKSDCITIMLKEEGGSKMRPLFKSCDHCSSQAVMEVVTKNGAEGSSLDKAEIRNDLCAVGQEGKGYCSMMRAPLKVKDKVLGVVSVVNSESGAYRAGDLKLLTALASQAAAPIESARLYNKLNDVLKTIEVVNQFNDVDTILNRILLETRRLANAEAGAIFLAEDDKLNLSCVHNEAEPGNVLSTQVQYSLFSVPIADDTLLGHVALSGRSLAVDDVYQQPENIPFAFDPALDRLIGYRSGSVLTIPLKTHEDRLLGVMQIINARNERGEVVPFSREGRNYIPLFANNASASLERAISNREKVLRMMKLAEMRDPKETGCHVQRVGAYSAEIYRRWAMNRGVGHDDMEKFMDLIRLASMLHDVGKVGISDVILKKPGRLSHNEFAIMKWHTIYGARLFIGARTELDKMCYDIALRHHERWSGGGYPGRIADIMGEQSEMNRPINGDEIPLAARIATLADVYDALCSRRVYKDPWSEDKVLSLIDEESGGQFDPDLVEAFYQIYDVIKAIKEKYREEDE